MMAVVIQVCGTLKKCKKYNIFAVKSVVMVEKFGKKVLTLWVGWYNIILILYIDRMRGDV